MKKTTTIFIFVLIGLMISGVTHAQRTIQLNQIDKGNRTRKNHIDLKTFREFNDFVPAVHHRTVRVIQKVNAEEFYVCPGSLSHILTSSQKETITSLKLIGKIDARDFKTMRDSMFVLSDVDLSKVSITAYTGTKGTTGPSVFAYPENIIPQKSFVSDHHLISIILPVNITSIGDSAFYKSGLSGVLSIPNSVTSIGNSAFEGCWNLDGMLTIPNSVRTIGVNVFADCQNIKGLLLSNKLTAISDGAFNGDWSLTGYLTIPNSVTSIGNFAFYYCFLTGVLIPNSVTSIGFSAFEKCKNLSGDLVIPNSITTINDGTFAACGRLTSITIPTSVTIIGDFAFTMSGLSDVIIPNSVLCIGDYAFAFTKNKSIPNSIQTIGVGAFYCSGLSGSLIIPNSLTYLGSQAFAFNSITNFIIQNDNPIFSVLDGVLFNKNQTRLIFYPSLKQGSYATPNSVLSIDDYAFEYCRELTDISIQSPVTTIGIGAFYECTKLNSIKISTSVTRIGKVAFGGCNGLKSVYVDSAIPVDLSGSGGVFGNTTACTLYVPMGSKTLYQSADQWKDFGSVLELIPNSLTELMNNNNFDVYPTIVTEGFYIDAGETLATVTLYSLSGLQLLSKQVTGKSYIDITTMHQGVYLIKMTTSYGTVEKKLLKKS